MRAQHSSLGAFKRAQDALDTSAYAELLQRLGDSKAACEGKKVHAQLLERGYLGRYLANHLIQMYGKCGCVDEARSVFDWIENRNLFSWTLMLAAYAQNGHSRHSLQLYHSMDCEGIRLDDVAFVIVVDACSASGSLPEFQSLHDRLTHGECLSILSVSLGNSLITLCATFSRAVEAERVFRGMIRKDVVSWTAMISAFAENGHSGRALRLFLEMEQEGVKPDSITFLALLEACSGCMDAFNMVHARVTSSGSLVSDVVLSNAAVTFLGSCSRCLEARSIFDRARNKTTVSWNAMLVAYARNGHMNEALELYKSMLHEDSVAPNQVTLVAVLDVCSNILSLRDGEMIHQKALDSGLAGSLFVENALVDMYGKCGSLDGFKAVFDGMKKRDIVSWTSLIVAYEKNGKNEEALEAYHTLHLEGLRPDKVTFVAALEACGNLGMIRMGRSIHNLVSSGKLEFQDEVATALVNMYVKCGRLPEAKLVSERLKKRSRSCAGWNSEMIALAEHGESLESLKLFREMNVEGIEPDDVSFVAAIFACSHGGMLMQGIDCFQLMVSEFRVGPRAEHYVCLVELMTRVGELEPAIDVVEGMPCESGVFPWMVLLGSANLSLELGSFAAKHVFEADLKRSGAYVLLSNLLHASGVGSEEA